jgi:pimeloyl-ACP methyl ester carboxylesterase
VRAVTLRRPLALLATFTLIACAASVPVGPLVGRADGPPMRRADLDGIGVAYTVEGPDGAPPVVLVHPWAGSTRVWDAVAPALARDHRVIRIDLPGHGASDKPDVRYDIPLAARAVERVLDALGLPRVTLIGNSLGGAVVLTVANDRPERVDRLVLIDALGGGPVPAFFAFFIDRWFTAPMFYGVDDGLIERFAEWFVFEATGPWTDAFLSQLLSMRASPEGWAYSRSVTQYLRNATGFDATPWLAFVRAPTLVVWGDDDVVIAPSAGRHLAASIPGARLEVLEGCGHMPEVECPEALLPLLTAFLR